MNPSFFKYLVNLDLNAITHNGHLNLQESFVVLPYGLMHRVVELSEPFIEIRFANKVLLSGDLCKAIKSLKESLANCLRYKKDRTELQFMLHLI